MNLIDRHTHIKDNYFNCSRGVFSISFLFLMDQLLEEQSRERVTKSVLNQSTSKQLWTFSKRGRFKKIRPECPHAFYNTPLSTLSKNQSKFSQAIRLLFTEQNSPSPAQYQHQTEQNSKGPTFGQSREKCTFSQYVPSQSLQNPAPTDYEKYPAPKQGKGYTMRPKTAHTRNYFIEDRELNQVPGPSDYDTNMENAGKLKLSQFRTIQSGGAGLMVRSQRFFNAHQSPGPSSYEPKKISFRNNSQGTMGKTTRSSWIEKESSRGVGPGPGDYNLPSQFGHYLKPRPKRVMTIS